MGQVRRSTELELKVRASKLRNQLKKKKVASYDFLHANAELELSIDFFQI